MSAIDPTKPVFGTPTTQSVRDNFAAAKLEIEDLQSDVAGMLPLGGGTMTGPLFMEGANQLFIQPTGGGDAFASMKRNAGKSVYIGASTGNSIRWQLILANGDAESGSNAGSNLVLNRFDDTGAFTGEALRISRASGAITAGGPVTLPADPTTALQAATKQYVDAKASGLSPLIRTASYTIAASDVGKLNVFNSGTAVTATIPSPATIGAGNVFDLSNINTGVVLVNFANGGTVDNSGTSFYLAQGGAVRVANNGTNWLTERSPGQVGAAGGIGFGQGNTIGITNVGFAAGTANTVNNNSIAMGATNTSNGNNVSVAIGNLNSITANGAVGLGTANIVSAQTSYAIGASNTITSGNPLVFGFNNQVSGSVNVVAGQSIVSTGVDHTILLGYRLNDRGLYRGIYEGWSGPDANTTTPMQEERHHLWIATTGTAAVRMTADGAAAGAANVANLGSQMTSLFQAEILITDVTTGNGVSYFMTNPAIYSRGTTAATTVVTGATITAGPTIGAGLTLAGAPTVVADTVNGGLNFSFTPPAANTDSVRGQVFLRMRNARMR